MATDSINAVKSRMKNIREWVTPARTTTAFLKKGVLTPEEFVKAGDELVFKCPTWAWEGGDPSKARSILPIEKQFLVTRSVPCAERAETLEQALISETEVEIPLDMMERQDTVDSGAVNEEKWLVSHIVPASRELEKNNSGHDEDGGDFDFVNVDGESWAADGDATSKAHDTKKEMPSEKEVGQSEEDEYADMGDFEDESLIVNDATDGITTSEKEGPVSESPPAADDNIKRVRTYDISITYDKYYQTPRVWIFGYDEEGNPLSPKEMCRDVLSDYVNRTVTVESHPHIDGLHLSIHPCQHGSVMKNIVRNLMKDADSKPPDVEIYLFIFLKFVSSIIPTMNYDFTHDVKASTRE